MKELRNLGKRLIKELAPPARKKGGEKTWHQNKILFFHYLWPVEEWKNVLENSNI